MAALLTYINKKVIGRRIGYDGWYFAVGYIL